MIEVKLSFPNLEAAITALAAVRQATGSEAPAPKAEVKDTAKPDAGNDKAAKAAAVAAAKAAEKAKAAETAPTAGTAQTAASPTPPTESPSPGATKEQVSAAITEAVKTDRQKVVDTLTAFGAKSGKDLKPEQFTDFLAKLAAAMAVTEDLA